MKKLFSTILVICYLLSGNAFGQSMISLRAYIEKNKNNKDYEYYIYYRCTAVYTYATRSTTDEELRKELMESSRAIMSFSMKALSRTMKLDTETAIQRVSDHVELIHEIYITDGYEHHSKTGSYLAPYMKSDIIICRELHGPVMEDILKQNK